MAAAVVLLSGGLDSAACLAWAIREGFEAHALTIDYRQRHAVEIDRARELAGRLGASSHRVVAIDLSFLAGSALTDAGVPVPKGEAAGCGDEIPVTYVPARNALFLTIALAWAESMGARDLVLGVNAVDFSGYPDCRPAFLASFAAMAAAGTRTGASGAAWRIHAPLIALSKSEIVSRAVAWGVPVGRTVSCYDPDPGGAACGACDACRLRARGFGEAGVVDA